MRDELLVSVQARVQRMISTGDLAAAFDPDAIFQARCLAETLAEKDLVEARVALGWWHWLRYRASAENADDLELAVRLLMPPFLVEAGPLPEPLLPLIADEAVEPATGLLRAALDSPDPTLLASVIRLWRRIIAAVPDSDPERHLYLSALSGLVMRRFERAHDPADLDEAIEVSMAVLKAAAAHDDANPRYLYDYGQSLLVRFEHSGALRDLTTATAVLCRALEMGSSNAIRTHALYQLGRNLHRHFTDTGARADLDVAITILDMAVLASSPDEEYWSECVSRLSSLLVIRYERWGLPGDLDRTIEILRRALALAQDEQWLFMVSTALLGRFRRAGDPADLGAAVILGEPRKDLVPVDAEQAERLTLWGSILYARFEESGDPVDLNAALDAHRRALGAPCPPAAHRYSSCANVLRARYDLTGDMADLDEAVTAHRRALELSGSTQRSDIASIRNDLGLALRTRFERTHEKADLDEAIDCLHQAVTSSPAEHVNWGMFNANLGPALMRRYEIAGNDDDLRQGIDALRAAVAATPAGHRDYGFNLANLGGALLLGQHQDALAEARTRLRAAVSALPRDQPAHAVAQFNLAEALRAGLPGSAGDAQRLAAIAAYTRAAEASTAACSIRIRAYQAAARLAADSEPEHAADLLEAAVSLLPRLAPRQLARQDQQHLLAEFATLTNDAAALALACPGRHPERAMQLLETGRAVLYTQGLDTRVDLSLLRERAPDLAALFSERSDRLDALTASSEPGTQRYGSADRHRTAGELSETIDAIRRLEGFTSFLELPPVEELLREAAQGPIVMFNVSRYRSDALVVTPGGVQALSLPGLEHQVTMENIRRFHSAVSLAHAPDATVTSALSGWDVQVTPEVGPAMAMGVRLAAQDAMSSFLDWLWNAAAKPVLDALGLTDTPGPGETWPRVWWAASGILGSLPIHACGPAGPEPDGVMQRVVSSYIPTVRALQYSRRRTVPLDQNPRQALVVAMPQSAGETALRRAADEIAAVQAQLPHCTVLAPGTQLTPTRDNVLSGLAAHAVTHFACHAVVHPSDPYQSMLLLQDYATDPFTVETLGSLRLDHAELAYLSACETATRISGALDDEAIHLAGAFQLAGFRHVIGTLWAIEGSLAIQVAGTFYRGLHTSTEGIATGQAAFALHRAIQAQRARHPRTPSRWAAYVHIGA